MVLRIAEVVFNALLPRQYWVHIALTVVVLAIVRAFAQGRRTSRERDLHARVILVTVGFPINAAFQRLIANAMYRAVSRHLVLL